MPYKDFTEELTRLQNANIGAGFIMQAQADAMKRQDQATINTMALFNQSKNNLDNDLRTTDEQLKEMQESDAFKDGTESIDKMASNYEAMLNTSLIRQKKIVDVYQETALQLSQIGSEESLRLAGSLEKGLPYALANEKDRMAIPTERIKFMSTMMEMDILRNDKETSAIKLKEYKSNLEVMSEVAKLSSIIEPGEQASRFNQLAMNMNFDQASGNINFGKKQTEFMQYIFNKLADNPLREQVMATFDGVLFNKVRTFRRETKAPNLSGLEKMQSDAKDVTQQYAFLSEATYAVGQIEDTSQYKNARELYQNFATQYVEEQVANYIKKNGWTPESVDGQKLSEFRMNLANDVMRFASNSEIVSRMEASEEVKSALPIIRNDGMPTTAIDAIKLIHKFKYDESPLNNENYWRNLTDFKKKINISPLTGRGEDFKINPIKEISWDQLSEEDQKALQKVHSTGGKIYGKNVRTVKLMTANGIQDVPFDLSALLSNDGGWWQPTQKDNYKTYGQYMYENVPEENSPVKSKTPSGYPQVTDPTWGRQ